jgi:hypothetical protein
MFERMQGDWYINENSDVYVVAGLDSRPEAEVIIPVWDREEQQSRK